MMVTMRSMSMDMPCLFHDIRTIFPPLTVDAAPDERILPLRMRVVLQLVPLVTPRQCKRYAAPPCAKSRNEAFRTKAQKRVCFAAGTQNVIDAFAKQSSCISV